MMSEEPNNNQDKFHNHKKGEPVTHVGNAWIICRSKSHLGRIYYFNTFTGQAVWNLTPPEIEKARHRTKVFEKQSGGQIEGCPEPTEPPGDSMHVEISQANMELSEKFRDNTMNTPFANQTFSINPMVAAQCNNAIFCPPLATINQLGLNVTSQFNPQIWALPPTHQIYISPNTAIPNHLQTPINVAFNNLNTSVLNTTTQMSSIPLSSRFKIINNLKKLTKARHRYSQENREDHSTKNFFNRTEFYDLREKLSARRLENHRHSHIENEDISDYTDAQLLNSSEELLIAKIESSHSDAGDGSENGDNTLKEIKEAAKPIIYIENLKKFASPNAVKNVWYLVTDADVLTNNLDLISDIISSDECCRLLVPLTVMTDLRDATRSGTSHLMINSRRAIRYFTDQQKNGHAEVDEAIYSEANSTRNAQILGTGLKMVDGNYFVVIISDDEDLQRRKSLINIPIFTVKYIKNILTTDVIDKLSQPFENVELPIEAQHNSVALTTEHHSKENPIRTQLQNSVPIVKDRSIKQNTGETQVQNSVAVMTKNSGNQISNGDQPLNSVSERMEFLSKETSSTVQQLNSVAIMTEYYAPQTLQNSVSIMTEYPAKESQTDMLENNVRKVTVDAGVQTDDNHLEYERENHRDFGHTVHMDKIIQVPKIIESNHIENIDNIDSSENTNIKVRSIYKKREISLKRPLPGKSTTLTVSSQESGETSDKKQFKWRRRKYALQSTKRSETNSKSTSQTGASDDSGYKCNTFDINKVLPAHSTIETFNDTLESDTGSGINKVQNSKERIVIEETSTSGVISNSASIVDSDSIHSICKRKPKKLTENDSNDTNITDEASDRNFEEYFKMRSDEWVSRFVQIMEEALTQVLIRGPRVTNAVPPPWTIREATECIIKKFGSDSNVLDAARDFQNILDKISDDRGKIKSDQKSSEYLHMFSYGAYMIEMLQEVIENNEDLEMAAESLLSLLNEIMNPNLDFHDSTFAVLDSAYDTSANVSNIIRPETQTKEKATNNIDTSIMTQPSDDSKRQKYNLRSKTQKCDVISNNQPEITDITVESTFFSSLYLQKTRDEIGASNNDIFAVPKVISKQKSNVNQAHNDPIKVIINNSTLNSNVDETKNTTLPQIKRKVLRSNALLDSNLSNIHRNFENKESKKQSEIPTDSTVANFNKGDSFQTHNLSSVIEKDNSNTSKPIVSEPKIIRNFTTCLEIEEKLKKRYRPPLDLDKLDYDEDVEYLDTEKEHNDDSNLENNIQHRKVHEHSKIDANIFIGKIMNEIRDTFIQTQQFCKKSYTALEQWKTLSIEKRCEFKEKAARVHSQLNSMSYALNSISHRDSESENKLRNLLSEAGVVNLSNDLFNTYRDIITKSIIQANILADTVIFFLRAIEKL